MEFESFVLAASTDTLRRTDRARDYADAIEYRIDLAEEGLEPIKSHEGLPLIVTSRLESEGGAAPAGPDRLSTLAAAAAEPAVAAVDIELVTVREGGAEAVLETARDNDTAVIVSTHDFEGTPPRDRLRSLLAAASDRGDIAKLATYADGLDAVLDLLAATRAATAAGHRVATIAMGEAGRHSRAVAPLYGSRIGYAPLVEAEATAPGQYDLETLRELIAALGGPDGPKSQR